MKQFETYRSSLRSFALEISKKEEALFSGVWGKDAVQRFFSSVLRGKMVRGGLILRTYQMFSPRVPRNLYHAALAVECFHSSLLIHDDIIDRDRMRRGQSSIFSQYEDVGRKRGVADSKHFGTSMGICVGDLGFFLASRFLGEISAHEGYQDVHQMFFEELSRVALAEMQDSYLGMRDAEVKEQDVLQVYLEKTARYTFSLPFLVGAMTGGAPEKTRRELERIGEDLGVMFQIKDDELGFFGDEQEIGKPVGSDVREGKKTLLFVFLMRRAPKEERAKLHSFFGKKELSSRELSFLRSRTEELGVRSLIHERIRGMSEEARLRISELSHVQEKDRRFLFDLLEYNASRSV